MVRTVLVTLDGSDLAEAALGPARQLAGAGRVTVVQLRVERGGTPVPGSGEREGAQMEEARAYLRVVQPQLMDTVPARATLCYDDSAGAILLAVAQPATAQLAGRVARVPILSGEPARRSPRWPSAKTSI